MRGPDAMDRDAPGAGIALGTAVAINVVVLGWALLASWREPAALGRFLVEDGVVEWMQFLCFTTQAVLLGAAAAHFRKLDGHHPFEALALAALSAVVALAAVEEISWFQRVLGIETPDYFRQHNRQAETNLHNLALGDSSIHKRVLVKMIFLAAVAHNIVLPLLARRWVRVRLLVESVGLYLPPVGVALAYMALVLASQVLLDHPRRGELSELFGAVHYLSTSFAAYFTGAAYGRPALFRSSPERERVSTLFALLLAGLLLVAWLLAQASLRPAG